MNSIPLHQRLTHIRVNTSNGGSSAKTMGYMLKRWPSLSPSYSRPFAHRQ
ncbi:MAG: hypothetical protein LUP98_05120 [Methylococcaceae bacterium]|nr:hypothetical protein [Methylococcaceae bacterium]